MKTSYNFFPGFQFGQKFPPWWMARIYIPAICNPNIKLDKVPCLLTIQPIYWKHFSINERGFEIHYFIYQLGHIRTILKTFSNERFW